MADEANPAAAALPRHIEKGITMDDSKNAGLNRLNALPIEALVDQLFATCHLPVRSWAEAVAAARPFRSLDQLVAAAQTNIDGLSTAEVVIAHTGLTRIGSPITGANAEARWSREESHGVLDDAETARRLADANEAYERRFGHVFLISATGLSGDKILAELERRSTLDDDTETGTIKVELRKLVAIRLPKLLDELASTHD